MRAFSKSNGPCMTQQKYVTMSMGCLTWAPEPESSQYGSTPKVAPMANVGRAVRNESFASCQACLLFRCFPFFASGGLTGSQAWGDVAHIQHLIAYKSLHSHYIHRAPFSPTGSTAGGLRDAANCFASHEVAASSFALSL